jgi:hypothetical protein
MYRCEQLPKECGGANFKDTLGYDVNMKLYKLISDKQQ